MFSTPTVVGELLFIGSCAGNFYAINKTTGTVKWSYDIRKDGKQQSFHGDPLVTNDLILIGTDNSCDPEGVGHVYAFERDTGKVRWKYLSTSVPTDIVQLNSDVYFGSFQDNWSSVDLHTGDLKWSFSTGATNKDCDMPKAPVPDADRLFIVGLDGVIYSLDASSGRVLEAQAPGNSVYSARSKGQDHLCRHKRSMPLSPERRDWHSHIRIGD